MAFSKQRAKPSASHVATTADEIELTATADETVTNIETADEMRMEETTDDLWTEETADTMRTEETGEDVAAELGGDNTIRTIHRPCKCWRAFSWLCLSHVCFVQRARDGLGCQVLTLPSDPANIADLRLT